VRNLIALALVIAAFSIVGCAGPNKDKPTVPGVPAEVAAGAKVAEKAPAPTLCELRGKFTLADGTPARDVALSVMGWESNSDRVRKYGAPENWKAPSGTSNADGTFSIRFDPPRAYQFVLSAQLPGWCETSWRWGEIEPGKTIDVGAIELVRGGSIRGRIVDAQGRVLSKGWRIYAEAANGARIMDREPARVQGSPDATTGEFVLEGLPAGPTRLKANSRIANWIEGPIVDVRAGEESKADITYSGPDNESRITVVTFCRPYYVFESEPGEITLTGTGIEPRTATKIANSSQSFSFDDVPPGSYTVEIHDPLFQPWSKSGVQPGTSINAHLKGSASVALQVLDETGRAVPHYALDVRFDKVNFSPNTIRALEAKQEPPAGGVFDGLIPRDQTLIVLVDGYAPCEVPIPDLKPGENRAATAQLSHGQRVAGRVVTGAHKTPFAGAKVVLAQKGSEESGFFSDGMRTDTKEATSDAQGRFAFEGVAAGEWIATASRGPLFTARSALTVAAGTAVRETEIVLPAPAWLAGKLIGPAGASFGDLRALAVPVAKDEAEAERLNDAAYFAREDAAAKITPAGTFRLGPLPAGDVRVSLLLPDIVFPSESGSSSIDGQSIDLGTVTLSAEGDTGKDFDVRDRSPGTIAVHVRVNGQPGASHLVVVNEQGEFPRAAATIVLDAQGFGHSAWIKPGTYSFETQPTGNAWIDRASARPTLKSAESIELDIDIALVKGRLHVLDSATGKPIPNGDISLHFDDENGGGSARVKTDSKGDADLQLPLGKFRVIAGTVTGYFQPDRSVAIEWTPAGPVPAEVKLPPPEFPR
jgi:hypothetical protein